MRAGKLAGVQLILNNWFLLLMLLFAAAGMFWKVLGVFMCVLWHEAAHALLAAALGYKVREMELLPFGGVARIEGLSAAGAKDEIWIAAAGPLASLGLAACLYFLRVGAFGEDDWLAFYWEVNLMLALFNLLPAFPLDGGRILRAFLSNHMGYERATRVAAVIGNAISACMLLAALGDYMLTGMINVSLLFIAAFVYAAAKAECSAASFRSMQVLARKKQNLAARSVMPTASLTAVQEAAVRDIISLIRTDSYYVILVLDASCHLKGMVTETEIWEELPFKGMRARIGEFL